MRVGRREFAWVFPQLSLLGQTSSESCMTVDEGLFTFFDFLVFARCFPASFSSFLDVCQTADSPSHTPTVTCRWYVIIFLLLLLLLLLGNDLEIACFCNSLRLSCNSHDRSNEPNLSLILIKIWTSSKLMRVDESWRSNESESCDSHPLSSSFDQALTAPATVHGLCAANTRARCKIRPGYFAHNQAIYQQQQQSRR